MKTVQKDTYGSSRRKKTGYSVERKTAPVQNNVQRTMGQPMQHSVQRKLAAPTSTVQREIQSKVVRPADRGRVETDPTQGWGTKLNAEIMYNRLPNKQVMQNNGEYTKAYKSVMKKRKK